MVDQNGDLVRNAEGRTVKKPRQYPSTVTEVPLKDGSSVRVRVESKARRVPYVNKRHN